MTDIREYTFQAGRPLATRRPNCVAPDLEYDTYHAVVAQTVDGHTAITVTADSPNADLARLVSALPLAAAAIRKEMA